MNNEQKIARILFEDSYKEFHIRLLAREARLNPNTIINITKRMQKEGLLKISKDKERNLVSIKADTGNRLFRLKKQEYNVEKIYCSGLVDHLEKSLSYPTIILFGSYAKSENHAGSDIDIFIIASEKKKPDISKFQDALGAEVQLFLHTKEEFKSLKKTNPELLNNVINGVILSGFLEAF